MAALREILEQALKLPERERGELIAQLLRSLEPDEGDELTPEEWESAWSAEIERRVHDIRNGAELVDGEEVMAEVRAMVDDHRR